MNKTDFKGMLSIGMIEMFGQWMARGQLPVMIRPTIQILDRNEILVDRVMEEDGQEVFFVKVVL